MIDAQQENGTDEPPARDVRWEGKLARLENKAREHTKAGLDWKLLEVEASVLERLLMEREAYLHTIATVRKLHAPHQTQNLGVLCNGCSDWNIEQGMGLVDYPCSTIKALA